jgi:hypothetical protein
MSTAPQIAFDQNDQFVSSGVPPKYFQLFAALTSQATRKVEFRTLIEGFVDSIGRAIHCDFTYMLCSIRKTLRRFVNSRFSIRTEGAGANNCRSYRARKDYGYRELFSWDGPSILWALNRSPAQSPA